MSSYIRSLKKEFEFDGDKILVTLRPILFEDTLRFNSLETIEQEVFEDEQWVKKQSYREDEVAKLISDILPKYIEKIEGLKDVEGLPVSIEDLCTVSYFGGLANQIGGVLIKAGTPPSPNKPGEQ